MTFRAEIDQGDLAVLKTRLHNLVAHLPSHNVAALRRTGEFVEAGMKRRAQAFQLEGQIVRSIGVSPVKISQGPYWSVEIGPGAKGTPVPVHASLMEEGWKQGKFPPTLRIMNWAARRFGAISVRQAFFIARAIARRGALSPNNPRAHGDKGYHYVFDTFMNEGREGQEHLWALGFDYVGRMWN